MLGNAVKGRAVTHEAGFANGQAIDQRRPLDSSKRPTRDVIVIGLVVRHLLFAHARAQAGLQERLTLIADADTGPLLEQGLPLAKLFRIHFRQLLQ